MAAKHTNTNRERFKKTTSIGRSSRTRIRNCNQKRMRKLKYRGQGS